jgi:dihydropteroate synthase
MQKMKIIGTLNITPDSFYDGGKYVDTNTAVAHAIKLVKDGADMIDLGGESSRPGSKRISTQEELHRIIPVLEKLVVELPDTPISIDTYKPEVADACLEKGATLINDITGLRGLGEYTGMAEVVAKHDALILIMHMQGDPSTMQNDPIYRDVVQEISDFLMKQVAVARSAGIKDKNIILDPGIGFGKAFKHNLSILKHLDDFAALGFPILIGTSRKSFIEKISGLPVEDRLPGTLASAVLAAASGAYAIRVHDVLAHKHALEVTEAILRAK